MCGWYSSMIKFRRSCPLLGRTSFLTDEDITWHEHNWDDDESRFLAFTYHDRCITRTVLKQCNVAPQRECSEAYILAGAFVSATNEISRGQPSDHRFVVCRVLQGPRRW